MKKLIFLLAVPALVQGCLTSQPDDQQYAGIKDLYSLDGCYDNLAKTEAGVTAKMYLSTIIWQQLAHLPHNKIAHIDVKAISDKTIVVTAIAHSGEIVLKNDLRMGDEFELDDGAINFTTYHEFSFAYPADYQFASAGCEAVKLGVDPVCRGSSSKGSLAGAALLVWPDPSHSRAAMRFDRNWESCEQHRYGIVPDRAEGV